MNFLDTLAERPLVADGAMGTMINARGVGFERSFEGLNLAQPSLILDIHREFVAAGADVLETNTFSATELHLERWGSADRFCRHQRECGATWLGVPPTKRAVRCSWPARSDQRAHVSLPSGRCQSTMRVPVSSRR